MVAVQSYRDFQEYMGYLGCKTKLVPILLIKPYVLMSLVHDHHLDYSLKYFNKRTGGDIAFFLPGYKHDPYGYNGFFPSVDNYNNAKIVFSYSDFRSRQGHKIYFHEGDFEDFIDTIERNACDFKYYGSTELLLPSFVGGGTGELGNFDFASLSQHRYDLTNIFFKYDNYPYDALRRIEYFVECVIQELRKNQTFDLFYEEIDRYYRNI